MSTPMMNSVLSAGTPSPAGVPPLSLSMPTTKPTPPSPPVIKPQTNHTAAAPISLVQENKAKTPEKPKDVPAALPKPTSNGVEEPPPAKAPVVAVPEPSVAPPVPAGAVIPAAAPAALAVVPAVAAAPPAIPVPAAPAPAPVAAPAPPVVNHAAEPPSVADAPPAPAPPPEPEPAEDAPPSEPSKPKAAKPQAAKRRREPTPAAPPAEDGTPEKKSRRIRAPVNPYQSPLPEITTVINRSLKVRDNSQKLNDEKLIVFYKHEFLAVRNAEGGFYLCQTVQNIYRTSHKIHIRWLSRNEKDSTNEEGIYTRDFYDSTDFECILTTVSLQKKDRNQYKMPAVELERVESILKRALDVEKGVSEKPAVTEEHPDGLDLSLYRDESQLQKTKGAAVKRRISPSRKSSSPKKPKKQKSKAQIGGAKAVKTNTPTKVKVLPRKPVAKKAVTPAPTEKKLSRSERSSARDRATAAVPTKATEKSTKVDKIKTSKGPKGKKKVAPKAEKVADVKAEKKQDKKKTKAAPAAPVASSSKKVDKGKKAVAGGADKRSMSTRKKGKK